MRRRVVKTTPIEIQDSQKAQASKESKKYEDVMQSQAYYLADSELIQSMQAAAATPADICTYSAMYDYLNPQPSEKYGT